MVKVGVPVSGERGIGAWCKWAGGEKLGEKTTDKAGAYYELGGAWGTAGRGGLAGGSSTGTMRRGRRDGE